jgi:hypothetical protein
MWKIKRFTSFCDQLDWINRNDRRYQIVELFVNNGYAVEYKPLRRVY